MGYFSRSFDLAKRSWHVLKKDKELMLLPVFGLLSVLAISGVLFAIVAATESGGEEGRLGGGSILLIILGVFAGGIAIFFFKGALVAGAHERIMGGDPTVSSALRTATSCLRYIVPWAIFATVVGIIIDMIQRAARENLGVIGAILGGMVDFAWRVLTFLVMPVIIVERQGPFKALGRSKSLLKATWGENLIAHAGMAIVGFLFSLPAILMVAIFGSAGMGWVAASFGVIFGLIGFVLVSSLSGIYQTVLYEYATSGKVPPDFAGSNLESAFAVRERRGGNYTRF